ncbi:MAG: VWA domain-containing protein [Byssovorax sp.]
MSGSTSDGLVRGLDELLWVLRREGFSISTAQALDVVRVVRLVGFEDRGVLRDAIGAVVVDRRADQEHFGRVFEEFFSHGRAHPQDLWGKLRDRGFTLAELNALRQLLNGAAEQSGASGDAMGFAALLGSESELDQILMAAGIARALAPMSSALQTGYFTHQVLDQLGVARAASALHRIRDALRDALGDERGRALADAVAEELARVRRRAREHVSDTLARRLRDPDAGSRRRAEGVPFTSLSAAEIEEVRRAVRALAERLRGAERVRRRHAARGRIDPHRTLRQSLRTFGVPFQPARKRRRRDKPRLFVLCDVSDSVRAASLFMLEFAHAAQDLFSGTRSFVFVSELGETTRLFADEPVATALGRVYAGGVVDTGHNSNYGRVLRAFEERVSGAVDRRTTIVILGDGRTNYFADEAEVLGRLRDRARAVLWLCPEGQGTWGTGDSAMLRYAAAATKVLVARTAKELELAAREVVARR